MKISIILYLALFSGIRLSSYNSSAQTSSGNNKILYQCPMKCEGEKTYAKPGTCPVCGMDLEKIGHTPMKDDVDKKSNVHITGAMMNVMHKGELYGTIHLDTISNRKHLFGLGPIEYLKGEILIDDGISYISKVAPDGSLKVGKTYQVSAPFFVYGNVDQWKEFPLPDSIRTIPQLEIYLDQTTKDLNRPFCFKLSATIESAALHVVNLPEGTSIHSPEEAHQNQKEFDLKNEKAQLIGFFSTEHQGIFTHHDTYVHIHLITDDKKKMGHIDNLYLKSGTTKLFLPAN